MVTGPPLSLRDWIFTHHSPNMYLVQQRQLETFVLFCCVLCEGTEAQRKSDHLPRILPLAPCAIAETAFPSPEQSSGPWEKGAEEKAGGSREELQVEAERSLQEETFLQVLWDLSSHGSQGLPPSLRGTEPLEHSPGCSGVLFLLAHLGHLSRASSQFHLFCFTHE